MQSSKTWRGTLTLITFALACACATPAQANMWATPPEFRKDENGCFRYVGSEDTNGDGVADTDRYVYIGQTCAPPAIVLQSMWQGVNGIAFEDTNANGVFELGEHVISFAYFKLTDGGQYYKCGYVGTDGTFAIPVKANTYVLMPIAPPGYRTTTPYIRTQITDAIHGYAPNLMGFVQDSGAHLETCDQYNPPRIGNSSG